MAPAETGRGMPSPALVEADDYVLIHFKRTFFSRVAEITGHVRGTEGMS